MHVHCFHWLMLTGMLLQGAFLQPCKSMTGEMTPMEGSNSAVGTWYDITPTVSTHLSRPCCGILARLGAHGCHSHAKLYHCVILLLSFSLCHHPPYPHAPPAHPFIYTGPIAKISHYLLVRLVVQRLIGKTGYSELNFQISNSISKYWQVQSTSVLAQTVTYTVNGGKFAGLNICSFSSMKFFAVHWPPVFITYLKLKFTGKLSR